MTAVLVTGAGRGIGEQAARLFLERGAKVFALDKDFSACTLPAAAQRFTFDLRDLAGIPRLVAGLGGCSVMREPSLGGVPFQLAERPNAPNAWLPVGARADRTANV